ncbi:MAG: hypothetical protein MRQ13_02505 [Candidatus Midichloria sp.]|nr:hypothetical protein [Candidatus Midichloria sp.]
MYWCSYFFVPKFNRIEFKTTIIEELAIVITAIRDVIKPIIAIGTAKILYMNEKRKFCFINLIDFFAVDKHSATENKSFWNTISALLEVMALKLQKAIKKHQQAVKRVSH